MSEIYHSTNQMLSKAIGTAILAIALFFLYDQYKDIHRKGNYGIDSPFHAKLFSLFTITSFVGAIIFSYIQNLTSYKRFSCLLKWILLMISFICFLGLFCSLYASLIEKFSICDKMLNHVQWKGNEKVLDVGCGRGLFMYGAALRMKNASLDPTGTVTCVDIWNENDQSGNTPQRNLENAKLEQIDRKMIHLVTGDARQLPFDNHTFDIVMSSLTIHNIYEFDHSNPIGKEERKKAIDEMIRVLKPGGKLLIWDIFTIREYFQRISQYSCMENINLSEPFGMYRFIDGRLLFADKNFKECIIE